MFNGDRLLIVTIEFRISVQVVSILLIWHNTFALIWVTSRAKSVRFAKKTQAYSSFSGNSLLREFIERIRLVCICFRQSLVSTPVVWSKRSTISSSSVVWSRWVTWSVNSICQLNIFDRLSRIESLIQRRTEWNSNPEHCTRRTMFDCNRICWSGTFKARSYLFEWTKFPRISASMKLWFKVRRAERLNKQHVNAFQVGFCISFVIIAFMAI